MCITSPKATCVSQSPKALCVFHSHQRQLLYFTSSKGNLRIPLSLEQHGYFTVTRSSMCISLSPQAAGVFLCHWGQLLYFTATKDNMCISLSLTATCVLPCQKRQHIFHYNYSRPLYCRLCILPSNSKTKLIGLLRM